MYKRLILFSIFLLLFQSSFFGQENKKINFFPIWTYHQKNINIHGISIGIGTIRSVPRFTNTNGIKIELIGAGIALLLIPKSPLAYDDSSFIALANQPISEIINGISLSATGTVCDCKTNGINIGLIGNLNYQVNGLTCSLFMNFSQIHNGLQFALINESFLLNGFQMGLSNFGYRVKGIQFGLWYNENKEMKGVQIGIINKSENIIGFQFGLWNINQKRKSPFINWNFK